MSDFFEKASCNFTNYKQKVDSKLSEQTNVWKDVFEGIPSNQLPFYQSVFNVICHFLNGDVINGDLAPKQLFIQIPMKELGRSDKQQWDNIYKIHEVVGNALIYATASQLYENTKALKSSLIREGDCYYTKTDAPVDDLIWSVCSSTQTPSGVRPCIKGRSYRTSEAVRLFDGNLTTTIRINQHSLGETKHARTANIKSIRECYDKLISYKDSKLWFTEQYTSAKIIGYSGKWLSAGSVIGSNFIFSSVGFDRKLKPQEKTDILVLIGDIKYKHSYHAIQNALAYGDVKKVIYIGSNIYEGYEKNPRNVCYSFSFRELFTCFYGKYPEIHYNLLEFPWLINNLSALKNILIEKTDVYKEYHKSILTIIAYNMLGIDFNEIPTEFSSNIKNRLLEEFDVQEAEIDNWLDNLSLPPKFINPKAQKRSTFSSRTPSLLVSNKKREITKYINNKGNKYNQKVFIDVKGDWSGYLEIIRSLLSQGLFGEYHILTYVDLPHIRDFFEKEINVYNNPYRVNILGFNYEEPPKPIAARELADFFDPNMLDLLLRDNSGNTTNVTYCLDGSNGVVCVTGDVIYGDNTIPISEVMNESDDILPAELTYYVQPDNFEELVKLSHQLGDKIDYYANLWKDRLCKYCNEQYAGEIKKMAKERFPFMIRQFKSSKYIDVSQNTTKFPDNIGLLAQAMYNLHIINIDERNNLIAARRANEQNKIFGRKLKEALYTYKIKKLKNSLLTTIEQNAKAQGLLIDADTLVASSLITDHFTSIKKLKEKKE